MCYMTFSRCFQCASLLSFRRMNLKSQDPNPTAGDADDNNCTEERSHMADGASLRLERRAALNCHPLHRCDHHCDPLGVIIIIVCLFV